MIYLKFPDFQSFSLLRGQVNVAFPASPILIGGVVGSKLSGCSNCITVKTKYCFQSTTTRLLDTFSARFYYEHFVLWEAGALHDDSWNIFLVSWHFSKKAEKCITAGSGLVITSLNLLSLGRLDGVPVTRFQKWYFTNCKSELFTVLPANLGNLVSLGEKPRCARQSLGPCLARSWQHCRVS